MMKDKIVITIQVSDGLTDDLEVPVDISANDLIVALSKIYSMNMTKDKNYYFLRCENPKILLRGNRSLKDYGIYNGTKIWMWI